MDFEGNKTVVDVVEQLCSCNVFDWKQVCLYIGAAFLPTLLGCC